MAAALLAGAALALLLIRNTSPKGQMLLIDILIALACLASAAVYAAIRKQKISGVMGTSLAGAVAHNAGQILMACAVLHSPQLLTTYLPVLTGIGAAVGCLTGIVTERVMKALRLQTNDQRPAEKQTEV